jgi:nucleotide-binding universal stress UspA family protein
MTDVTMQMAPRQLTGVPALNGPVLLATKPFNGLDAPLAVARWLAERQQCALRAVSVLEQNFAITVPEAVAISPRRYEDEERWVLAKQIRGELTANGNGALMVDVDVLEGPSAQTVVESAQVCDARMIVVGTGKHDPIGRYIYGERALQIAAIADRPVLIVPAAAVAAAPSVAVVAVDFSPASARAARAVLPLLSAGGRLIIVHVKPSATHADENTGWWNDAYERRCADLFAQFIRALPQRSDVHVESKFIRGDVVHSLLDYAITQNAGVIACGRLGHSLMARVFVGSVSTALVRHATCPVLVAPELHGDQRVTDNLSRS